jgi:hypothetical protein
MYFMCLEVGDEVVMSFKERRWRFGKLGTAIRNVLFGGWCQSLTLDIIIERMLLES